MAFNAGTIIARLKLDSRKFTAELKKSGQRVKGFTQKIGTLKNAMGAVFGFLAIRQIRTFGQEIFNLADKGGRVIDLSNAFEKLAEGAGTSAFEVTQSVRAITKSLSGRQIQQAANTMQVMGLGIQNLPRFLEIARAAAITFGRDTSFMLESIALGTARQSRLILDNLGIIISAEVAYTNYARKLGKTSSQLTEVEKKQGFVNEVMRQGQSLIDGIGGSAASATEDTQSLVAATSDLSDAFSRIVNVLTSGPAGKAANFINALSSLLEASPGALLFGAPIIPGARTGLGAGATLNFNRPDTIPAGKSLDDLLGIKSPIVLTFKQFFKALQGRVQQRQPQFGSGTFGPSIPGAGRNAVNPALLEQTLLIPEPELINTAADAMKNLADSVELTINPFQSLGASVETFFTALVDGSGKAGAKFAAAMLNSIGSVASRMGDLMLFTGLGLKALSALKGGAAILAGLALKALAGTLRGLASKQFGGPTLGVGFGGRSVLEPGAQAGVTQIIINGDVWGDPVFMDRMFDLIRRHKTTTGDTLEVVTA